MMTRREAMRALAAMGVAVPVLTACGGSGGDGGADGAGGAAGLGLAAAEVARERGVSALAPEAAAAVSALAGGLYAEAAARGSTGAPGNLVLSAYSVAVALAMTANGASGETAAQMHRVLGVETTERLNDAMAALTTAVEALAGPVQRGEEEPAEVVLEPATGLFAHRGLTWRPAFLEALARHYGTGVRLVDFAGATERARELVNDWTAERTADRIPEILPPGSVDPLTRLVLLSALYLKAPWETPFDAEGTSAAPFTLADGRRVEVPMMSGRSEVAGHGRGEGFQVVRWPYVGGGLSFTVLLPDPGRLPDLERAVGTRGVHDLLASARPAAVALDLPRFEVRSALPLADVLKNLGMVAAFDPALADFDAMVEEPVDDLHVQAVLHEAFVAVDEEGTEAAAATAVVVGVTSAPQYVTVRADRPFLFVIHDTEHGVPLFLGRVADPTAG